VLAGSVGNGADSTGVEGLLTGEVPPEMRLPNPLPNLDGGFAMVISEEQKVLFQQILS
jgi:hypothetical protein